MGGAAEMDADAWRSEAQQMVNEADRMLIAAKVGPVPPGVSETPSEPVKRSQSHVSLNPIEVQFRLSSREFAIGMAYMSLPFHHDACMKMLSDNEHCADPISLAMLDCNIGWCFLNGRGCTKDYESALTWFRRRRPTCAGSQYNIATCYKHGLGTLSDDKLASEAMGKYYECRVREKQRFEIEHSGAYALDHK